MSYTEVAKALMWELSIADYNDREIEQIVNGIERTCYIRPESDYITEAQLEGCLK
jgi:C-terminal processing protease CtpA/Prc